MNANILLQAQQNIDAGVKGTFCSSTQVCSLDTCRYLCACKTWLLTHWQCALQVMDTRLLSKKQKGLVQLHKREMKLKAVGRK